MDCVLDGRGRFVTVHFPHVLGGVLVVLDHPERDTGGPALAGGLAPPLVVGEATNETSHVFRAGLIIIERQHYLAGVLGQQPHLGISDTGPETSHGVVPQLMQIDGVEWGLHKHPPLGRHQMLSAKQDAALLDPGGPGAHPIQALLLPANELPSGCP